MGPPPEVRVPEIREGKLSNGTRILLIERHDLPLIAMALVLDRGRYDAAPGVGALIDVTLTGPTKTHDGGTLWQLMHKMAAQYRSDVYNERTILAAEMLTPVWPNVASVLAEWMTEPAYDGTYVDQQRPGAIQSIGEAVSSPSAIAIDWARSRLFPPEHRLARTVEDSQQAMAAITPEMLRTFHTSSLGPGRLTIVACGEVSLADLTGFFDKELPASLGSAIPPSPHLAPAPRPASTLLINKPGPQTGIALTLPGPPRRDIDAAALEVAVDALGGRVLNETRYADGYTYGLGVDLIEPTRAPGRITVHGLVQAGREAKTLLAIRRVVGELRDKPLDAERLERYVRRVLGRLSRAWMSHASSVAELAEMAASGAPFDESIQLATAMRALTPADVQKAAETYFDLDRAQLVLVGDVPAFQKVIQSVVFGPVEVR